ncbi:MAG: DEAD/DEAH box helicase [Ignisphaera sp.]|nr:DEAD/DEAH box helicase [Ignisphaera sp.]MCX8167982.1 DEAD/DEAH box helicase [Ignisphaera sp.]MDW8085994.1 DEAD/DEAH box helicase [Ignisphaera sp.]
MSSSIVFYISEWIDEHDFKVLLKFSRYLGREGGRSKFSIDLNKLSEALKRSELKSSEVLDILMSYEVEFERGGIEDVKKLIESYLPRIVVEQHGRDIVFAPNLFLGDIIKDLREENKLIYDKNSKVFKLAKPMHLFDVINTLRKRGIEVVNRVGITERMDLPLKVVFKGTLRDYQIEALEAWKKNGFKGIISLPTGTGKTIIGLAAMAEVNVKTLVVTYTKEQMFQWRDKVIQFTNIPPANIGLFYSSEKRVAPVTMTTYQSAFRYIDTLAAGFSMLIVDEVHHLPADKFRFIAENMYAPIRLGLSATVIREDGRHTDLFPLMGGVVYNRTLQELIERGYIAPFRVERIYVQLTPDERKRYKELLEKYKKLARNRKFEELLADSRRGDTGALEAIKVRSELRSLVHNAERKMEAIIRLVDRELKSDSKIIVFTQYVEQAKRIAEELSTYYIVGDLDDDLRKSRLDMFRQGYIRVLVLTTVGDEGIDVPDANVGIIVAGTGSKRQFIQRLGRLLRPLPGKEARLYEVIVKGTFEEAESRKRREALKILFEGLVIEEESY